MKKENKSEQKDKKEEVIDIFNGKCLAEKIHRRKNFRL